MTKIRCFIKSKSKAIAGGIAVLAMEYLNKKAIHAPFLTEAGIATAVTSLIIYLSPKNAEC